MVSYTTVSPLPSRCALGGLFSVALSRGSPRVAVNNHPALWSPDFPRQILKISTRPPGRLVRRAAMRSRVSPTGSRVASRCADLDDGDGVAAESIALGAPDRSRLIVAVAASARAERGQSSPCPARSLVVVTRHRVAGATPATTARDEIGPTVGFLAAILVFGHLCAEAGVFDYLALGRRAELAAAIRVGCWLLVVALGRRGHGRAHPGRHRRAADAGRADDGAPRCTSRPGRTPTPAPGSPTAARCCCPSRT